MVPFGRTLTTTDADGQVTLFVYGDSTLAPATFASNPGSANQLYAKYYFDNATDYSAFIANPSGTTQPNETIVYAYYTAADVSGGVTGAYVGEVKSITDNLITPANGDPRSAYTKVTTFQYDSNGNLTQESGPSGTINYVYDLATQRHTETWTGTAYANAVSDIQYGYNSMGELASVTVLKENGQAPAAVASSTVYNATGGTSTTNLPNTVYIYDPGSRLTSSFDSATGIATTYTYKPSTNYISTETVTRNLSPVTLAVYSYAYRADGLKTGEVDTTYNSDGTVNDTRTLSWQYDGLDRVTQETSSDTAGTAALNYTDLYQYDLNSNRTTETEENGSGTVTDTITSSYNADNELTQAVDANTGTTVYTYDNNGSQTSVTSPTGTTTNVYDLQDRLASVVNKNSNGTVTSSATYEYDDSGNRIEETTVTGTNSPVTTYFVVDTQTATGYAQVVEQSTTPGTPTVSYVWGLNLLAQNNAAGTPNAGTYYFVVDGHGSTVALINASGNVVQTFHYDGFGNALGFTPSSALTQYLYNQQYYDVISGQYYMRARNYDPATGTFTQQDTISLAPGDIANSNLFLFAGADPANMVDPAGHMSLSEVLTSISISTALIGFAPVGVGIGVSLFAGLPDALGVGGFFEADLGSVANQAGMLRVLVGAEVTFFPRAGEAQVSIFGPYGLEPLKSPAEENTIVQWLLNGQRGKIGAGAGLFQAWYWNEPRPSSGLKLGLGFIGGEFGNGILAGAEGSLGAGDFGIFSGFTIGEPQPGGFGAGGGEYNFAPFHMSEAWMLSAVSAGESLFTLGLSWKFAGGFNYGSLAASVVNDGLTAAWIGWTYG